MFWYLFTGILVLLVLTLLVINYLREQRYLKKKTSEAMGSALRESIEAERAESMRRREKFAEALNKANKNRTSSFVHRTS